MRKMARKFNFKIIVSLLLVIAFMISFLSGFFIHDLKGLEHIHEISSYVTLILMLVHIVTYWKVIVFQVKRLFSKN